jgi:hypothetical protein
LQIVIQPRSGKAVAKVAKLPTGKIAPPAVAKLAPIRKPAAKIASVTTPPPAPRRAKI